jgi:hypothetical protein
VTTPADFGRLGTPPTHPALLDWLAAELRENGWSLKRLHRTIMLSTAYRQSSRREPAQVAIDSENRFYGRRNVLRLDAETLRDRVLAAAGTLDATMFGPSIGVQEDDTGQVIVAGDVHRRSIYLLQRRTQPVALMQAFDAPVMTTNCEARPSSTVATQSLMLMNGDFWIGRAAALAERVLREPTKSVPPELIANLPQRWEATAPLWQFGYGKCDVASGRTASFAPLGHWTGTTWQGGKELPDAMTGWVLLHADGGHPGNNPDFAAIRRWTAPIEGDLSIDGTLGHGTPSGDGVRGRIVASSPGITGVWTAYNGQAATKVEKLHVKAGDTVDFITDCRDSTNADSFTWQLTLSLQRADGTNITFHSKEGFHGPAAEPMTVEIASIIRAWQMAYLRPPTRDELQTACKFIAQQRDYLRSHPEFTAAGRSPEAQSFANLCQALVSSNEFLYID